MNFTNLKNIEKESIRALESETCGNGCRCSFTYPMDYSQVCVFEFPINEAFSEEKALSGAYRAHMLKYPKTELSSEVPCNFAVFPINAYGEFVRQECGEAFCPVTVLYEFFEEKRVIVPRKLFRSEVSETNKYIRIVSNIDIHGREILYTVDGYTGVFCIPTDLKSGAEVSFKCTGREKFFPARKHIRVVEKGRR